MSKKFHSVGLMPEYEVYLAVTPEEYENICWDIDYPGDAWLGDNGGGIACLHTFLFKGRKVFVVCINDKDRTPIDVAALLVHEATHVKQRIMEDLGEHDPSKELEAYCIQYVSYELFRQYTKKRAS